MGKRSQGANHSFSAFLEPFVNLSARVLAWVRFHTLCYPIGSPYWVDKRGDALRQKDCARELKLNEGTVSRHMHQWAKLGLITIDDGRLHLCGQINPEVVKAAADDQQRQSPLPVSLQKAIAAAIKSARQQSDQM
jgi:hypothetical protein